MAQPTKRPTVNKGARSKTVKKATPNKTKTVGEIIKKRIERSKKPHPQYGTSKLEDRFASDFLDKAGYSYTRQFEAKDIKRFYDFAIKTNEGSLILIEVDGDYFHGKDLVYEEKSPMQKKNERVDKLKDEWAAMHCIPLIRIWEDDINNHPEKVRKMLKEKVGEYTEIQRKKSEKNKRH